MLRARRACARNSAVDTVRWRCGFPAGVEDGFLSGRVESLPVIGALGGAAINYAFARHFHDLARGHFTVRRLERTYGRAMAQAEYEMRARAIASKRDAP